MNETITKIPFKFENIDWENYRLFYGDTQLSSICKVVTPKGYEFLYANLFKPYHSMPEDREFAMDIYIRDESLLYLVKINN